MYNLRIFIKEHQPATLREAVHFADNWASARNAYRKSSPPVVKIAKPPSSEEPSPGVQRSSSPAVRCHNCGEEGHIRSRCPRNPLTFKSTDTHQPSYKVGFCLEDRSCPVIVSAEQ
ncbi:uncharacterized protein LOC121854279 [Homarus americanus]|uniref:uncharacterized protein LOC121854279 n=1 Tax=Homarus americanus TaxID=6706 RepID=UPI001C468B93|nr:uncharacterized protein LOC121854279 [Homarus americanus]